MINYVYELIRPKVISKRYETIDLSGGGLIIRPDYLAICKADQRYYLGRRDNKVLSRKLPMALIHEASGVVVYDPLNRFSVNERVVLMPNVIEPVMRDSEVYENYNPASKFCSSTMDGFMSEYVLLPHSQVIRTGDIPPETASISELVSVGFHAVNRLAENSIRRKEAFAVWGDGCVGYVTALILKHRFPDSRIIVAGRHKTKLSSFSFADEVYLADEMPPDVRFGHAFECAGGSGSALAVNQIIERIEPQGSIVLMGVSENLSSINTRDALEKGLLMVCCSRSGYREFIQTIEFLKNEEVQMRFKSMISEIVTVKNIDDIHASFQTDLHVPFKTVMKWEV